MMWQWIFIGVAVGIGWLIWSQRTFIHPQLARQLLQQGAILIDVRNPHEYESRHLSAAINIPLDELDGRVPREFPDPRAVLLLHCASGVRSGIGQRMLRKLGYTQVHNVGSYGRAQRIADAALQENMVAPSATPGKSHMSKPVKGPTRNENRFN
jgi:phage shock protein E